MSSGTRPTVDQILRQKLAGHCTTHIQWADAKKKASKHVDVRVFKLKLGDALDSLEEIVKNVAEVKKLYPKLDDRALKPVRARKARAEKIIKDYQRICLDQMKHAPMDSDVYKKLPKAEQAKVSAWDDLLTQLDRADSAVGNTTRSTLG